MSLNSEDNKGTGAGGSAGDRLAALAGQAPRLQAGGIGYAAWKPAMDVFLQRAGAEGIHRTPLTEAAWLAQSAKVEAWAAEALAAALALALGSDGDAADASAGA